LTEKIKTLYTGTDGENNLYYHDGNGTYTNANLEAGDNSYRYAGGYYKISDDYSNVYSDITDRSASTDVGVIKFYCSRGDDYSYVGASCGSSSYTRYFYLDYDESKTQYYTLNDVYQAAIEDGSIDENVNNYVCFGTDAEECPAENLYRIIGVFNNGGEEQVKLIKWDFATSDMLGTTQSSEYTFAASDYAYYKGELTTIQGCYWSGSSSNQSNTWSSSTLNKTALNTNYMTYLGNKWTEMIESTTWKVGGNTLTNIRYTNAKTAYTSEIVSSAVSNEYEDEIGLMYVSDYYYAASPTYWSYSGHNSSDAADYRAAINDNWMYSGVFEWSITRHSDNTISSFRVISMGSVKDNGVYDNYGGVRPVFYLKSNVVWKGRDGSKNLPYRVGI